MYCWMVILIGSLHCKSHLVLVEQRCVHADISHAYSSRETTFSSKLLLGYFILVSVQEGLVTGVQLLGRA